MGRRNLTRPVVLHIFKQFNSISNAQATGIHIIYRLLCLLRWTLKTNQIRVRSWQHCTMHGETSPRFGLAMWSICQDHGLWDKFGSHWLRILGVETQHQTQILLCLWDDLGCNVWQVRSAWDSSLNSRLSLSFIRSYFIVESETQSHSQEVSQYIQYISWYSSIPMDSPCSTLSLSQCLGLLVASSVSSSLSDGRVETQVSASVLRVFIPHLKIRLGLGVYHLQNFMVDTSASFRLNLCWKLVSSISRIASPERTESLKDLNGFDGSKRREFV